MADSLGLESGVVRLVEYDARWPALFAAEQQLIRDQCGTLALRLEHVGGTSIPGMCTKPVLDIAAGRPRVTSTEDYVAALTQAGYEHRGERGVPGRELFCKGQPRAYHLHLVEEGGPLWREYVAFRDYLRGPWRGRAPVRRAEACPSRSVLSRSRDIYECQVVAHPGNPSFGKCSLIGYLVWAH